MAVVPSRAFRGAGDRRRQIVDGSCLAALLLSATGLTEKMGPLCHGHTPNVCLRYDPQPGFPSKAPSFHT